MMWFCGRISKYFCLISKFKEGTLLWVRTQYIHASFHRQTFSVHEKQTESPMGNNRSRAAKKWHSFKYFWIHVYLLFIRRPSKYNVYIVRSCCISSWTWSKYCYRHGKQQKALAVLILHSVHVTLVFIRVMKELIIAEQFCLYFLLFHFNL